MKKSYSLSGVAVLLLVVTGFALRPLPSGTSSSAVRAYPDPVRAEHGMVVSAHEEASRAGIAVLKAGGNAVDAAVATGFALAVVYPVAGNIGGGGFMVIRPDSGEATTIDYREKAPMAATEDMFLDSTGAFVPERSQRGYLASGVPGTVAGLLMAHERYGALPLNEVMAPAIRLAADGFTLTRRHADRFNAFYHDFAKYPAAKKYFTKGDSTVQYEENETFRQEDLADVLRRVRDQGRDGFYRGKTANLIVEQMEKGGGLITSEDLEAYEAVERATGGGRLPRLPRPLDAAAILGRRGAGRSFSTPSSRMTSRQWASAARRRCT